MRVCKHILPIVALIVATVRGEILISSPVAHTGMCDASAAVPLGSEYFAVANDEDNVIRVYRVDQSGPPLQVVNLAPFLQLSQKSGELDLEGAARVGDRIYWITSHGRDEKGRDQPGRRHFFATDVSVSGERVQLKTVGRPYLYLLQDLLNDQKLKPFKLAAASRLAPKTPGGLNIEALCATREGHLLIGLRNPVPRGKALVVPLLNPEDVVAGGKSANFGEPILLDLEGRGVREIACFDERFLVIAGAPDGKGKSRLYEWTGGADRPTRLDELRFDRMNPEGIVFYADKGWKQFLILSDDGGVSVDGRKCKDLKDPSQKSFRSVWVKPRDEKTRGAGD